MLKKIFGKFLFVCFFILLINNADVFSQESSTLLEIEMQKVEDEFKSTKDAGNEILPSEIIQELSKPGNEGLLEQVKKIGVETNNEDKIKLIKDEEVLENQNLKKDEEEKKIKLLSSSEELLLDQKKAYFESIKDFYGYNVFLNNIPYYDKTELPINGKYTIGPGDELTFLMWGEAQISQKLIVTQEGTCFVPDIGVISVYGLTVSELEGRLKKLLAIKYNTIDPPNGDPTTFFDISFAKMRSVSVFLNGEILNPGAYTLEPRATIFTALLKANGITSKGTLRKIKLIRDGVIIKELDLYDYLQTGQSVNDVTLKENDNIFVGPRISTVSLLGETLNPLKFELTEDETLEDLIKYSGGLLPTASSDRIRIERIIPVEERKNPAVFSNILDMPFVKIENGKAKIDQIQLNDFDVVTIFSIPRILRNYVILHGAVYRKGRYQFDQDMTILDLLSKAGGYLSDAFLTKVELIRTNVDHKTQYFSLDLSKKTDLDFKLNSLDSINIFSTRDLISKDVVIISGEIRKPGFQYLNDSMRVSDLIFTRGGLVDKWTRDRTFLLRADLTRFIENSNFTKIIPINLQKLLDGDKSEDVFLKDGDQLHIYSSSIKDIGGNVEISGFVKNEGQYTLTENMTVEELILKANGFKEGAFKYEVVVFRTKSEKSDNDSISTTFTVEIDNELFNRGDFRKSNFFLKRNDHVVVRRSPFYYELRKVFLSGEFTFPGVYSLVKKDETLREVIDRAGGLTSEAFIEGLEFMRNDSIKISSNFLKAIEGDKKNDVILKNKDNIFIPKRPGTVEVKGFVYTPGVLKYRNDWSLQDYIEAAGGTIKDLEFEPSDPVVYFPGGDANVDNGWLFSPRVKEGSTIIVSKVKKEPSSQQWVAEIRSWLGIITSTLTVILLIDAVQ